MIMQLQSEITNLIEANRARALWHLAPDYLPQMPDETRRVLRQIAARGDRATWIRARTVAGVGVKWRFRMRVENGFPTPNFTN